MVAAALGVGTAAAVGAPLVLAAAGFSAAGVAAGSAAAAWQATIGNVPSIGYIVEIINLIIVIII